ncbi:MAG: hypothetical protein KDI06_10925 [Calditrichaeota bacterium]|nr:hypothetical protein [Calditrichota bacterium]HQU70887.1 hypothetical protein [Calditrichia bacterium]
MMLSWIEIIGYCGSLTVALSLTMSNIRALRWLNLLGAIFFVIYGLLISSYPLVSVNGFIVAVDIYYLWRLNRNPENISLLFGEKLHPNSIDMFLEFYRPDIQKRFDYITFEALEGAEFILVQDSLKPAGILAFRREGDSSARILLDYLPPEYRDNTSAYFFHRRYTETLRELGISQLVENPGNQRRERQLRLLDFAAPSGPGGDWIKKLSGV